MKQLKYLLHVLIIIPGLAAGLLLVLNLTGIRPYVVLSGSMEPAVPVGAVCFLNTHSDYEHLQKGDIIAFQVSDDTLCAHRIVSVTEDGIETKGDANDYSDGISTDRDNYRGKVVFQIPGLGKVIAFFQTGRGKIIGVTGLVCLMVLAWTI